MGVLLSLDFGLTFVRGATFDARRGVIPHVEQGVDSSSGGSEATVIDWTSVFDEAYPVAGAPAADLERLVAEVGRPLPPSYLSLLGWSDGGEFRTGGRWFQFFPALAPGHGVRAVSEAYNLPQYMPQALPFAFNGGGTFYLFDMRGPAVGGEYPVVCNHAGSLGWSAEKCVWVAGSFLDACRGTIDVDELG